MYLDDEEEGDKLTLTMLEQFTTIYDHHFTDVEINGDVMDASL